MQRWFRLLGAAVLALGLTACRIDTTVTVDVQNKGSGTVTVEIVADQEVVSEAPNLANDLRLGDFVAAGWEVTGPTPTAEGGLSLIVAHPFATPEEATRLLAQLSGPEGPFSDLTVMQRRAFAKVVTRVSGKITAPGGVSTFADNELLAQIGGVLPYESQLAERGLTLDQAFGLRLVAIVPGEAERSDGTTSPTVGDGFDARTTVDWTAQFGGAAATAEGQSINLQASVEDALARRADRLREFAPWALAAWGALFLLVIVPIAYLIGRRRM